MSSLVLSRLLWRTPKKRLSSQDNRMSSQILHSFMSSNNLTTSMHRGHTKNANVFKRSSHRKANVERCFYHHCSLTTTQAKTAHTQTQRATAAALACREDDAGCHPLHVLTRCRPSSPFFERLAEEKQSRRRLRPAAKD